ncbi:hypothetical protein FOM45_05595 [Salmonella enterica]|nr:hypothetical protein [Salmonella enterica]
MCDKHITCIPAVLLDAMKHADAEQARRLFDDSEFCGYALSYGLTTTGHLLEDACATTDFSPDELQAMGKATALSADLIAGMFAVVDAYRYRQLRGELPFDGGRKND